MSVRSAKERCALTPPALCASLSLSPSVRPSLSSSLPLSLERANTSRTNCAARVALKATGGAGWRTEHSLAVALILAALLVLPGGVNPTWDWGGAEPSLFYAAEANEHMP